MSRQSFCFIVLSALSLSALGQTGTERLAVGTMLLASEKLGDPNFAETVVLIVHRDSDGGTLGVVLNRPLDTTLAKAFPQLHGASDPIYEGGPVSPDAVQALLRTSEKPDAAEHVAADIYAVATKALLEKSISDRLPSSKFRVYFGYAGWGPGQLENEVRLGAWTTVRSAKYVFDGDPKSLWDRLNRDAHSQLAQLHATMEACRCFDAPFWR